MTRNLKALGLALVAVGALGAIGAQGALAASDDHEFHSDGQKTVITGTNVGVHTFQVGAAGTVECTEATFQGTQVGTLVTSNPPTYKSDKITIKPTYGGCKFGGQPATVFFNHCAYEFDSETTEQASTATPGKHANVAIECSEGSKIQVHTVNCTITVGPQEVPHAVRYENESVTSATRTIATAHKIVVGKERNTIPAQPENGCLLFPTGAVGKYLGTTTNKCFRDDGTEPQGTAKTTPPTAEEGPTTDCKVTEAPIVP